MISRLSKIIFIKKMSNYGMNGKTFDKINELAEKNNLSFNSVVNQIIEYGLENLEE